MTDYVVFSDVIDALHVVNLVVGLTPLQVRLGCRWPPVNVMVVGVLQLHSRVGVALVVLP